MSVRPQFLPLPEVPAPSTVADAVMLTDEGRHTILSYVTVDDEVALVRFDGGTVKFGFPGAEVQIGHPLYAGGLSHYEIRPSLWIEEMQRIENVHDRPFNFLKYGYRHFVFRFEDSMFECAATSIEVSVVRGGGQTPRVVALAAFQAR